MTCLRRAAQCLRHVPNAPRFRGTSCSARPLVTKQDLLACALQGRPAVAHPCVHGASRGGNRGSLGRTVGIAALSSARGSSCADQPGRHAQGPALRWPMARYFEQRPAAATALKYLLCGRRAVSPISLMREVKVPCTVRGCYVWIAARSYSFFGGRCAPCTQGTFSSTVARLVVQAFAFAPGAEFCGVNRCGRSRQPSLIRVGLCGINFAAEAEAPVRRRPSSQARFPTSCGIQGQVDLGRGADVVVAA